MSIGSSKIGLLGGLSAGGTLTLNAPGTYCVPPGIRTVSITGTGSPGNPGNPGNSGNPGDPGSGGAGGMGGAGAIQGSFWGQPGAQRLYTGAQETNGGYAWKKAIINTTK